MGLARLIRILKGEQRETKDFILICKDDISLNSEAGNNHKKNLELNIE